MNRQTTPQMSVVLVTPDRYETIRKTISCLRAQTVRDQLEIVIVAPSADNLQVDEPELTDFFRFRIVEVGKITSIASANAAGIRAATASIVALGEDHAFPDREWAQALINAHQENWVAVGPEVRNANPQYAISWADFLMGYGPWLAPAKAGETTHLPGHNSSYKRNILLEYGPELEVMLSAETVLHWNLCSRGYRLYLEPKARIAHVNFERLGSWIPALFYSGRMFAAVRSRSWSWSRRLFYTAGAPFIPFTRLLRILPQLRQVKKSGRPFRLPAGAMPASLLGLIVSALGEMSGYALGAGSANTQLSVFEFHRARYLKPQNRAASAGDLPRS